MIKFFALFLLIATISKAQTSGGKLKPEQAIMDIRHYTIALDVNIPDKSISGYTTIDLLLSEPAPTLLFDLVNDFNVQKVWVNGRAEKFLFVDNLIHVNPGTTVPAGKVSVKIQYAGHPHVAIRPPWEDGFTWATDSTGHPWVAITAEGGGGKMYYPCKDHPSDEPNEGIDMIITVPKGLVVAGPGLLTEVKKQKSKDTYHWKTNYTINNYSIIFNVGDYDVVSKNYTSVDGHTVPMQFYVLKYHAAKAMHHLEILESMLKVKEKYFGEYPWAKEKIGIVETPHLGMEHQSMNAYGNNFKYTSVAGKDFDWLMNHELGHEWWGNKVTAKDWADYWIHEGIGTFGDALYTRDMEGEAAYIRQFKNMAPGFANEKPIVQGIDLDEESAYINDIYGKGAFFMHTLRYILGDSIFFPTIKKLATAPQYTYDHFVNTNDVQELFSTASGVNLKPLFDLYLRSTKKLEVQVNSFPSRQGAGQFRISVQNIDMAVPMDVQTDKGVQRMMISKKPVAVKSETQPVIDPDGYYLKRVIYE
jgi:aminopeptidase N